MVVLMFVVCKSVKSDNRTLDLIGVTDTLAADKDRIHIPALNAVLKVRFEQDDEGETYLFGIEVVDPDGKKLISDASQLTVPGDRIPEGKHMMFHYTFELPELAVSQFGEYSVHFLLNAQLSIQWPLSVVPRQPAG